MPGITVISFLMLCNAILKDQFYSCPTFLSQGLLITAVQCAQSTAVGYMIPCKRVDQFKGKLEKQSSQGKSTVKSAHSLLSLIISDRSQKYRKGACKQTGTFTSFFEDKKKQKNI